MPPTRYRRSNVATPPAWGSHVRESAIQGLGMPAIWSWRVVKPVSALAAGIASGAGIPVSEQTLTAIGRSLLPEVGAGLVGDEKDGPPQFLVGGIRTPFGWHGVLAGPG